MFGNVWFVCNENDSAPVFSVERCKSVENDFARLGIKVARWFIGKNELGFKNNGT